MIKFSTLIATSTLISLLSFSVSASNIKVECIHEKDIVWKSGKQLAENVDNGVETIVSHSDDENNLNLIFDVNVKNNSQNRFTVSPSQVYYTITPQNATSTKLLSTQSSRRYYPLSLGTVINQLKREDEKNSVSISNVQYSSYSSSNEPSSLESFTEGAKLGCCLLTLFAGTAGSISEGNTEALSASMDIASSMYEETDYDKEQRLRKERQEDRRAHEAYKRKKEIAKQEKAEKEAFQAKVADIEESTLKKTTLKPGEMISGKIILPITAFGKGILKLFIPLNDNETIFEFNYENSDNFLE